MSTLAMWTVYKHPSDYPDKFVARRFDVDADGPKPSASIIIMDDLEVLRDVLAFQLHLVCLARNEEDDPVIVETWL
jgi:hypothetical protein